MMRASNRGDVPAPHAPPGAGKSTVDAVDEIFFDAGSLSYVKDWVEGGEAAAATAPVEPERGNSRLSDPNRRLGVGSKPKKSVKHQSEPTALQKKLARKRQRQELGDAVAGEVGIHGVVEDDIESEGESKTSSFKGKKKRQGNGEEVGERPSNMTVFEKDEAESGSASGGTFAKSEQDGEGASGRKGKTRRKKGKSRAAGSDGEGDTATSLSQPPATENTTNNAPVDEPLAKEQEPVDVKTDAREPETRKQRRGWGKARSKPPVDSADSDGKSRDGEHTTPGDAVSEEREYERPKRKKVRSRQKNIRRDKRSLEQRPAHLRIGDPEFSGRDLTSETRKALGLPPDDFDAGSPGWGNREKSEGEDVGRVIDKQRAKVPKRLEGNEDTPSAAVTVDTKDRRNGVGGSQPSRKSKYKNLALPLATNQRAKSMAS